MSYIKQDHKLTIQPKIYEKCPKNIKYKQTKKSPHDHGHFQYQMKHHTVAQLITGFNIRH